MCTVGQAGVSLRVSRQCVLSFPSETLDAGFTEMVSGKTETSESTTDA